jgi:hypothetical protein
MLYLITYIYTGCIVDRYIGVKKIEYTCTHYHSCTSTLAKNVLPKLINEDQAGYVFDRFIGL